MQNTKHSAFPLNKEFHPYDKKKKKRNNSMPFTNPEEWKTNPLFGQAAYLVGLRIEEVVPAPAFPTQWLVK